MDRSYGVLEGKVWKPDWELFLQEELKRYKTEALECLPGVETDNSVLTRTTALMELLFTLQSNHTEGKLCNVPSDSQQYFGVNPTHKVAIVTHDEVISKIIEYLSNGVLPAEFQNETKIDPRNIYYKNTSVTTFLMNGRRFNLVGIGNTEHLN